MAHSTAATPAEPGRWVISKFGPPSVLQWQKFEKLPVPGEKQVRVRILAAGIGAVDNMQRAGGYPDPLTSNPGFTPGYEFVGEVDEVGPGVHGLAVGTRVVSLFTMIGACATHSVVQADRLYPLEDADDAVKVTALPLNYMTAFGMLKRSGLDLSRGSKVLIGSAAGGLGVASAQLNKALDLGLELFGTASPRGFELLQSLGVTPIDRHIEDLPTRVMELTGGRGVDVAFNMEGTVSSIRQSLDCTVKETGKVRVLSVMSAINAGGDGVSSAVGDTFQFLSSGTLPRTSFWVATHDYNYPHRDVFNKDFATVLQAVRDGRMDPLIGRLFRLDAAVQAHELLANGAGFEGHIEFLVDAQLAEQHGI